MTKDQGNQYNRDVDFQEFVGENPGQFPSEDEYTKAIEALDTSMGDLQGLLKQQDDLEKSSAAPKDGARKAASMPLFSLASLIYAMAYATGNISLMEKVKLTLTDLKRLSDGKLLIRFDNILSAGAEYLPTLLTYGVTQKLLDDDTAIVEVLREEVKKFVRIRKEHIEVTKQIKAQFKVVNKCMIPFDNMIESKRLTDPAFYSLYWTIRKVDHSPASHVSAKGKVYDAVTRQALIGAIVNVYNASEGKSLQSGADLVKTVKVKSNGGGFNLKSLSTGTYIVTVTYAGYTDQEITIYVNDGNSTSFELALSKIE
jgi:hypothetical protein